MAINPNPELRVIQIGWVQEPASGFFSALIVFVWLYMLPRLGQVTRPTHCSACSRAWVVRWTFYVWIWAYFWSTVFHIHENKFTEAMDYYGANYSWSFMLYAALVMAFNLRRAPDLAMLAVPLFSWSAYYTYTMTFELFDYGWHVKVVGVEVGTHFVVWLVWSISVRWRSYCWWFLASNLTLVLCLPLEIGKDFAPIFGHFDGHSLWHCGGALISYFWARFLIADAEFHAAKASADGTPMQVPASKDHYV